MNTKVVNFIAAQFGILIGLMIWLIYMQFQSGGRQATALEDGAVAPFEAPAPVLQEENQQRPVPYPDRQLPQPVIQRVVQPVQYYQEPIEEPVSDSGAIPVNSISYSDAGQGPAVVPSDYVVSPQPIYYAEPTQIVVIEDSHRRRFRSPHRQIDRPGHIARQFPDRGNQDIRILPGPPPPSSVPLPPGGPPPAPPAGPPPGFQSGGNNRPAVHRGGHPVRATSPGTTRTGRTASSP